MIVTTFLLLRAVLDALVPSSRPLRRASRAGVGVGHFFLVFPCNVYCSAGAPPSGLAEAADYD